MISFRHATVLACTGADPVDDATVIVEGAVIKDVLTSAHEATRAGGEVIDCRGRTVMPGLIDAHVHVCAVEVDLAAQRRDYPTSLLAYAATTMIEQALDQGFTTIRNAGGADWGMKEAVDRGLIPGPRMFVSGHPLSQSGGHGDPRTRAEHQVGCGCGAEIGMVPNIADGVDEVRRAVRTQLRRGADAIKVMAASGTFLVPTFVTYEKLHEQGRERGLTAAQLAKLDLVLGSGLDALRRARDAGVRIGSGSDLLGPLARHKARELAIKASVLGAHQTLIATTKTNAELLGIAPRREPSSPESGRTCSSSRATRWPTLPCCSIRIT
jgi:imidazolonepropionase-like amidohydrolase